MILRRHIQAKAPILLLLFLALSLQLRAQEQEAVSETRFRVQGVLLDSASRQSIPYATLEIQCYNINGANRNDTLRQVTDDAGRFEIALPSAEQYTLLGRFVGMKPLLQVFTEKELCAQGLLRLYMAEDAEQLGEITVTANKPLVRLGIDRIAYNVKDDPASKTENLRDMLRRVPLVTVDGEGNVQVKGSGNYRIFLNGKPSTMISSNPKEVLRAIPASTVKKIEVITNPGVEYDAEGASAILNIITETGVDMKGMMGTIGAAGMSPKGSMASANLTMATGKVSITANYNYFNMKYSGKYTRHEETERRMPSVFSRTVGDRTNFQIATHMFNLGLTYEVNPKQLLSTSLNYNRRHIGPMEESQVTTFYPSNATSGTAVLSTEKIQLKQHFRNNTLEARADYQISTDNEGEMITLSYLYAHNPEKRNTDTERRLEGRGFPGALQQERTYNDANLDEHTVQVDYIRPFGEMHKLIAGTKYITRLGRANPFYELFSEERNAWMPGSIYGQDKGLGGSNMNYRQDVFSAYAGYYFTYQKFSLNTGLRAEAGNYKVSYDKFADADFKHRFVDFVPQLSLAYNFSQALQLKMAYNMHIKRPSLKQLNPYRNQTNAAGIEYGNSRLTNERVHNFDLAVSSYSQNLTLQASFTGEYINRPIANTAFVDPERPNVINSTFSNIGYSYATGINGFASYRPVSWLQLMVNANLGYIVLDAGETVNSLDGRTFRQHNEGWTGKTFFMANFTLPKAWGIYGYVGTFSQVPSIFISSVKGSFHGLGISKGFCNRKLNVSLSLNNPFAPVYHFAVAIKGPGFEGKRKSRQSAWGITFNVSYSFGELKTAIKKVARTIQNDDLSTAKGAETSGGAQGGQQGR